MNKTVVGITTFLRPDLVKRCVATIRVARPNLDIIVVDQNKEPVIIEYEKCKVFSVPFDCGLSASRNFLVKKAKQLGYENIIIGADSIFFGSDMSNLDLAERTLEDGEFELIGFNLKNRIPWEAWITLIPGKGFELDFLRKKNGNFTPREDYAIYVRGL